MDEPFAALDPIRRTELNKVVRGTCRALNATSIWVTHDVVEALLFADFIVAMTPAKEVEIFDTLDLPAIADSGALPATALSLRDRIIGATWGQPIPAPSPKVKV
jgi:ABC-type nitrate/sulfonate/bicarbonate transport system ATPase subunit